MVSGLQVLMGPHWGQGTVAGAWLLQPFICVVSRSLERSVYGSAGWGQRTLLLIPLYFSSQIGFILL